MKIWPFETRNSHEVVSATDVAIASEHSRALGTDVQATELLAAEIAASIWGRSFAAAQLSGDAANLVNPVTMGMIGRALARHGEIVFLVDGTQLVPASGWTITGQASPSSWTYRLNMPGPSNSETRTLPGDHLIHIRIGVDARRPWRGQSPLVSARSGSKTLAAVEQSFQESLAIPTGTILATAVTGKHFKIKELTSAIANSLRHGLVVIGSSEAKVAQIGPNFSDVQNELRSSLTFETLAAYGIGPVLLNPTSPAASLREAMRMLLNGTLKPLASQVAHEIRQKLDMDLVIDWAPLRTSDIAGQARAVSALVKSGMAIDQALVEAGIVEGDTQ